MTQLSVKELIELRVRELDAERDEVREEIRNLNQIMREKAKEFVKERKAELKDKLKQIGTEYHQLTGSKTGVKRQGGGRRKKQADVEASRTETFPQPQEEDAGSLESVAAE